MKSYMLLIGFIGLFTYSFNVTAMGGPGATYLSFDVEEDILDLPEELPEATYLSFDLDEEMEKLSDFPQETKEAEIYYLPYEVEEIIITRALDSILKDPLPKEQAKLNAVLNQYLLNFLIRPQLRFKNKKYYLNKLARKLFLTFGKHLNVPNWYLIKYFGQQGKQYNTEEELKALKDFILDYSFSLRELLSHNQFNRKVEYGMLNLSLLRLNNIDGLLKIPKINKVGNLHLNNNQLKTLPPEIGKLTDLNRLYLSNNQLTELPKEIGNLRSLWDLSLHDNQLTELPKEIGELTDLENLYLWSNRLKTLPKKIGKLKDLKRLYLDDNQLTELPSEIGELTNLKRLYLDDNQLKSLPPEMIKLTRLQSLQLEGNAELKKQEAKIRKMLPKVKIEF